jgi:hypothetical protein
VSVALVTNGLTIPPAGTLNGTSSSADARTLPAAGARATVPVVYGTDRIGALLLNSLPAGANSPTLLVHVLWCFACTGVSDVKLNGQALPSGSTVTTYTGSQTTADAALVAAFAAQGITYTTTLEGYAYSVLAVPTRAIDATELAVTGLVQGRKLYDPRKDSTAGGSGGHRLALPATWEHSDNPALALADFLNDATYGAGEAVAWASVATTANANDALVGSTEKRRTLGLTLLKPAAVRDWAETLRAYAGCWLVPGSAGMVLVPDANSASVATYTHAAGQIEAIEPLQLRDLGDSPTAVEVIYTDTTAVPWRDASATATLSGASTTKPWRLSTVRLPGIQRYSQAMREAIERLNKLNLSTITTTVTLFDEAAAHDRGDIITLTHPCGLSASTMRVLACERLASGSWALEVAQHSAAVYSDSVQTRTTYGDPSFVSPAGPPSTPTGLAVRQTAAGNVITWAANPESDVLGYELRVGGTDWASATPLVGSTPTRVGGTSYTWAPPASGVYTLRLVAFDGEGLQSAAAVLSVFLAGQAALFRVISRGYADTTAPLASGFYGGLTGELLSGADRSYMLQRIRRSDGVLVFGQSYDVYSSVSAANQLASDLNASGSDVVVVVRTHDEPQENRLTPALAAAMYRCGASRAVFGSPQFKVRSAYALVGIGGCGEGAGYEAYQGSVDSDTSAHCDVSFYIQNGQLIVSGNNATPRTLADYSYVGDLDATKGAPAGTYVGNVLAQDLVSTANGAASAATAAQASANTANTALAAISSDSVLSRGEKPQVVQDWLAVAAERGGIVAQANAYGITTARDAYTTAHDALNTYLSGLSPAYNDASADTTISGASFRLYWVQLYDARQALLNKIAEIAGQRAVWASVSGSGKPEDGATVGATFGVNIYGTAETVHLAATAVTNRVLFQDLTGDTRSNIT